tara:strand:+ start:957 stop:3167 length:2211 start_codon:yes stop_codon:yes gene_type:complete
MMTEEEKARRERFINGRNVQNKKALLSDDEVNRREAFISSQNLDTRQSFAAPKNERSIVDEIAGAGQSLLRGQTLGYGDEITGGLRAVMDAMVDTDAEKIGRKVTGRQKEGFIDQVKNKYERYRDEGRETQDSFSEANPWTATALELVGGVASPVNKIAPGVGTTGGALSRAAQLAGRGAVEGSIAGFGEGRGDLQSQLDSAKSGAAFGAGVGGGLSLLGGAAGRAISNRNVDNNVIQESVDAAGNKIKTQIPLHMAAPESRIGKIYRNVIGGAYGGRGALGLQESRAINNNPKLRRFANEAGEVVPETAGTRRSVDSVKERIEDNRRSATQKIDQELKGLEQSKVQAKREVKDNAETINLNQNQNIGDNANAINLIEQKAVRDVINVAMPSHMDDAVKKQIQEAASVVEADEILSKWFYADGFQSVKSKMFRLGDDLSSKIDEIAKANPEVKQAIGDLDSLLESGSISGERLMQVRNAFAIRANTATPSLRGKGQRTVAEEFDELIKDQLGEKSDAWIRYQADLNAWGVKQAISKASRKATSKLEDNPTLDQLGASFSNAKSSKPAIAIAKDAKKQVTALKKSLDQEKAKNKLQSKLNTRKLNKTIDEIDVNSQATKSKLENKKRRQYQKGRAEQNRLKRATQNLLPEDSSVWSMLSATAALGAPLGGFTPGAIPAGIGVSRLLSMEGAQRAVAGQTNLQQKMANALRKGDFAKYTSLAARETARNIEEEENAKR